MTKIAVIFDTNSCHVDRNAQSFFGQRAILEDISHRATLVMPQIVIDELIQQNIEGTVDNISKLKTNPLLPALGFKVSKLDQIIERDHAESLRTAEDLAHEVIDINDTKKAYEKIRTWVVPGSPPFNGRNSDGKKNSDKGLKDALVACTIDEILDAKTYDKYYLACNDGRLKEYYANSRQITCMAPAAILEELKQEFFDEYTVDVIRKEIDMQTATLKDNWLNINSDVVALFEYEEYETCVILDAVSKEIVSHSDILLLGKINSLTTSGGYSSTHEAVAEILGSIAYYSQEELGEIKDALMTNDQVYSIGTDEDVKTLASAIFNFFDGLLTEEEIKSFNVYYELKGLK